MNETNLDMQTKEFFLEKNALCEGISFFFLNVKKK